MRELLGIGGSAKREETSIFNALRAYNNLNPDLISILALSVNQREVDYREFLYLLGLREGPDPRPANYVHLGSMVVEGRTMDTEHIDFPDITNMNAQERSAAYQSFADSVINRFGPESKVFVHRVWIRNVNALALQAMGKTS